MSATSQVDNELAALKLELGTGGAAGADGAGGAGGADDNTAALPAADQSGNGNGGTPD